MKPRPKAINIGDSVKALRAHFGDSRDVFARRLGVTGPAIANYARGRQARGPVLASLAGLAQQAGLLDLSKKLSEARLKEQGFKSFEDLAARLGHKDAQVIVPRLHRSADGKTVVTDNIPLQPREGALFDLLMKNPEKFPDEYAAWKLIRQSLERKSSK